MTTEHFNLPPPPAGTRELTDHRIGGLNEHLQVLALDPPGPGGASHHYTIGLYTSEREELWQLDFQEGAIPEHGFNGISIEALLAICIDRLRGFQAGPFPSMDGENALYLLQNALRSMQKRTLERIARGVSGQHVK